MHGWKMPPASSYVPFVDPDNERDIGRSVTKPTFSVGGLPVVRQQPRT
ncbi:hypothetical protein ACIF8W_12690 [Streptomyces sp. NPDC085639]